MDGKTIVGRSLVHQLSLAHAEIERLQAAKRGALAIADERAKEAVGLRAENERLRAALQVFAGCAYPIAASINPRRHAWLSEKALDFALGEAKAALAYQKELP